MLKTTILNCRLKLSKRYFMCFIEKVFLRRDKKNNDKVIILKWGYPPIDFHTHTHIYAWIREYYYLKEIKFDKNERKYWLYVIIEDYIVQNQN